MKDCLVCQKSLEPVKLKCSGCGIYVEGSFKMSRLARLPREHQRLAEGFLMSGGNLKDLAASMDISYPTLRKRLDDLIAALSSLQKSDEETTGHILTQIESGKINAEEGMRLIKEMSHEL